MSCFVFTLACLSANEATAPVFVIRFENHRFTPGNIEIPSDRPVTIRVVNSSNERIEFESFKLNREKVIKPGETATLDFRPLRPGEYDFYDDFHTDVPEGKIVAVKIPSPASP